jgi:hypothetical protein
MEQSLSFELSADKEILSQGILDVSSSAPVRATELEELGQFIFGTDLSYSPSKNHFVFSEYLLIGADGNPCSDAIKFSECVGGHQVVETITGNLNDDRSYNHVLSVSGNTLSVEIKNNQKIETLPYLAMDAGL